MSTPELLASDLDSGRDLYFLRIESPQLLSSILEPPRRFVCLLVWDAAAEPAEVIGRVAEALLNAGCVYLCCWGDDCERVHDIADEVLVGPDPAPDDESLVMTTSHARESLDDALWFLLEAARPHGRHGDTCRSVLTLMIGSDPDRESTIRDALSRRQEL